MPDGSMAHFGAGGSGVGAKTLELALAEQRPVIAVVRNAQVAAGMQEKVCRSLLATPATASHRLRSSRSGSACHGDPPWVVPVIIWRTEPSLMKQKS